MFQKASKIGTKTRRNVKFVNNIHNYLKNQEMSSILKYFSFLCQLKGHDASNKLVTKDFDLKFGYKKRILGRFRSLVYVYMFVWFYFFKLEAFFQEN